MSDRVDNPRATALRRCREDRETETGQAFCTMLRAVADQATAELIHAQGSRIFRLQGAITRITDILREIESPAKTTSRHDGAYN